MAAYDLRWQSGIYLSYSHQVDKRITGEEIVASGTKNLAGMAMDLAGFTFDLTYQLSGNPDSCLIVLSASGTNPSDGDYLWVMILHLQELPALTTLQKIYYRCYSFPKSPGTISSHQFRDNT